MFSKPRITYIILLLFLILSQELFAKGYNFKPIELPEGKSISLDVVKYPKFVVFRVAAPKYNKSIAPTVTIENENGFECIVYDIDLFGYETDYDPVKDEMYFMGTWEIIIRWSPGVDLSGCDINISMPQRNTSKVHLFLKE